MPQIDVADDYEYAPQQSMSISLGSGNVVDLSSEYLGGATTYTWYRGTTVLTQGTHYTAANGVFTFTGLNEGDVHCVMTNTDFPDLTLETTTVTIVAANLSNEYLSGTTTYTWHFDNRHGTLISPSLYTAVNGVFTFTGLKNGDVIYCEMTNNTFPGLTLNTMESSETFILRRRITATR